MHVKSCLLASMAAFLFTSLPVAHADEPDDYELMKLFVDTFHQVETNYVKEVDRRELMEAAIRGMLKELDQYSSFIPPRDIRRINQIVDQEFGGIGVTLSYRDGSLVVVSPLPGTPAYDAGIRAGDKIVGVGGDKADGLTLSDAVKKLQGPVGRPVTLSVLHEGDKEPTDMKLVRQLIKAPTVRGVRYNSDDAWEFMLDEKQKIGMIRLTHFSRYTAEEVKAAVDSLVKRDVKGLVIDLRFNPGGLLEAAIEMADMFLEEGNIVSVRGRNVSDRSWDAKKQGTFPAFPIAVLVNNYSASASEVLSACLQDNHRAVIIGERTWGKGSVQNVIRMEEGSSVLKLTTASYHRPSGVNIHRFPNMKKSEEWGVTPDDGYVIPYSTQQWQAWHADRDRRDVLHRAGEIVKPSEEPAFDDVQLTKAVDFIKQQLTPTSASTDDATSSAPESADPKAAEPKTAEG